MRARDISFFVSRCAVNQFDASHACIHVVKPCVKITPPSGRSDTHRRRLAQPCWIAQMFNSPSAQYLPKLARINGRSQTSLESLQIYFERLSPCFNCVYRSTSLKRRKLKAYVLRTKFSFTQERQMLVFALCNSLRRHQDSRMLIIY